MTDIAIVGCDLDADDAFGPVVVGCRQGFDFTLLFEQAILSTLPAALAIVAAIVSIPLLWKQSVKIAPSGRRRPPLAITLIAFLCLGILQVALIVLWTHKSNRPTKLSVTSSVVTLLLCLVFSVLHHLHHSRSTRPPGLIILYLVITILFDVAQARTLWLRQVNPTVAAVFTAGIAVKVLMLPFAMVEKKEILQKPYSDYPPEDLGGILNRGVFWWINTLLLKGSSVRLELDHLFDLDKRLTLAHLMQKFGKAWESSRHDNPHALLFAVLQSFSHNIVTIVGFRVALIGFKFCQPLLINRAISLLLEENSQSKTNAGRALIGATSLVYVGIALTTAMFRHHVYRLITMIRGSLVGRLYDKTLSMDASIARESAALTLMSTDIERIANGFEVFDALWASPIEIALAMFLLYGEIGLAFLVPVVVSVVFIFIPLTLKDMSAKAQRSWVEATELRVGTTASVVHSMKGVKMSSLSDMVGAQMQALRVAEMKISSRFRTVLSASLTISIMSQVIIPFATLITHFLIQDKDSPRFDTTSAFTILTLVALLANPIKEMARAVPEAAAAAGCILRIQRYICTEELALSKHPVPQSATSGDTQEGVALKSLQRTRGVPHGAPLLRVKQASFRRWSADEPALERIDLSIAPGSWTVLTGPIGCGKSTLLLALMNELRIVEGAVDRLPSIGIGYCAQDPWLPNLSIRQLVTSEAGFDEERYWAVIDVCLLGRDLKQLPAGDQTVIGSNGISLSGGQRQRLSLARALYSLKPLLLLDDVLGGLDASTEEAVVDKVFGDNGFLRRNNMAAVLVSHSTRHARRADKVIVMAKGGLIVEQGPPAELSLFQGRVEDIDSDSASSNPIKRSERPEDRDANVGDGVVPESNVQDMQSELARQTGDIRLYAYYLKAMGWPSALGQIVFTCSFAVFLKIPTLWVRWWAEAEMRDSNAESGRYIGIYGLMCGLCMLSFVVFITLMFQHGIPRSSNNLHERLVRALMNAPYWFLVATDTGQITNRFSQDMSLLCLQLPFAFADTLLNVGVCAVGTVLITLASKYSLAIYPGLLGGLYFLQRFYLRTSRQIRLLDLEAKSPIYSHFMQTLNGLTTIRAFGWQHFSKAENAKLLDQSQRPFYLMYCIQRWLNLVLDLLVAGVATIVVALATQLDGSSSGAFGVSLLNIVTFSQDLTFLIRTWTDLETSLGAVARIRDFERGTPSEDLHGESIAMPPNWPPNGTIEFEALSSSYRKESQAILKDITLEIEPGTKVGICGRTGSGKSTLLLTLLRMAEIQSGDVLVDGVSIQQIPRNSLRRRLFAMPQDPLFFPGSVRSNIDPFAEHGEEKIAWALAQVGLLDIIMERGGLNAKMNAIILSKGQQQLLCLTRAILSKSKVILLDEITSSVDLATEAAMMDVVDKVLHNRTVLAIAHRLHTIRNFDKIVVLDHGRVIEIGSPQELLERKGAFWQLWADSNVVRDLE